MERKNQKPPERKARRENAPKAAREKEEAAELPDDVIVGRNAVIEALKSGRSFNRLWIASGDNEGSVREVLSLARERGIKADFVERAKIERQAAGHRHQGVMAWVAPVEYAELEDILAAAAQRDKEPFVLLLDELEDPHNLGALLRTADAVGVDGVLIPKHHSCPLSATVAKTSAGAVEYVPVARIGNIAQTLKLLKSRGFWVVGADMDGTVDYSEADMTGALVLVVGGEGRGISRLTKENCDFVVRLPMAGKINSLNASVAGSVLMYEAFRQRRKRPAQS